LETLRAFGAEQLARRGRVDVVAGRHARHQVAWVEAANRRMLQPGQPVLAEIDAAVPELRTASSSLLDHDPGQEEVGLAGSLVAELRDYGLLRLRPDVLAWSERVTAADPDDRSPVASRVWVVAAYAAWMAGDLAETGRRSARALRIAERGGGEVPAEVLMIQGSDALFRGDLGAAVGWYRAAIAAAAAAGDDATRLLAAGGEVLALGYSGDPAAAERGDALLADVGDPPTPHAAYVWHCVGEVDLEVDPERARDRFARALRLAELTNASFVTGLAGASKASIDARAGDPAAAARDYRWLLQHWRRAGMWSTQWTMLRSVAALLARLGRYHDAAVLLGAIRATAAGHRIFGADEVALVELDVLLRRELGPEASETARRRGAALDGDAAVEHALRAL
jgi:hypothetical protein